MDTFARTLSEISNYQFIQYDTSYFSNDGFYAKIGFPNE